MNTETIREFRNPSAIWRPAPLWVWNDDMTREQIARQLKELAEHGFGGAFVHPRPGLVTDYLSEEWFELWGYALERAKKLNVKLYIYDENSYPSGFGGGHVSALCPDGFASYAELIAAETPEGARYAGDRLVSFALKKIDGQLKNAVNVSSVPENEWKGKGDLFISIYLKTQSATGWNAGFPYVDLLRPEVHKAFIETTYEPYYRRFGADFGNAIPALFTDEPSVGEMPVPFSFWFANQFRRMCGYDIVRNLPLIFTDIDGDCFDYPAEKVRFDYYDTIRKLWVKNWIEASGKWCAEHNINYTGHYLEHQWPLVKDRVSPSVQSYYEFHQWPAIDMLFSNYLKDRPVHALTHSIRELSSASNQFGKERALCELYGAGGWDSVFDDYKRMADWVLVNGVNFIDQHLTYSTIAGARKHDHPQSFDWRQSWWREYTGMNDYIGRAQFMLTRGKMEQRILILNPSTTGYLIGSNDATGSMFSDGDTDCVKRPDMTDFLTLCQDLSDGQWDYDLGDEYTLARHAKAGNGVLNVVKQDYSVIIASGSMKNMLSSTVKLLAEAADCGVKIVFAGVPGNYIDGVPDAGVFDRLSEISIVTGTDGVIPILESILPKRIWADKPFPSGFAGMRRALDNGDTVWFFVNHSMRRFRSVIRIKGGAAKRLELYTGEVKPAVFSKSGDWLEIPLDLVRNQSLMLYITKADGLSAAKTPEADQTVPITLISAARRDDNILPILYCDYDSYYGSGKDLYTVALADRLFRERGFSSNPWDSKVQYRGNIIAHDRDYDKTSGFTLTYRFAIEDGFAPGKIQLAAEHPESCSLKINGSLIPWSGENWLDRHIGIADITDAVKCGENAAAVTVDVFRTFYEADAVYLKGDFGVKAENGRWVICRPEQLKYGSWKTQCMPFYFGAVEYDYTLTLDSVPAAAEIDAEWAGAALSVTVNGIYAGLIHADGVRPKNIADHLNKGVNRISLRVCASSKNLFGPHFTAARGMAWPAFWHTAPEHTPDPASYDLLDFGLFSEPRVTVSSN